jgi:hypothetical protein
MAIDAAIKFGRLTNDSGGYSVGSAQAGDEGSNVSARSQEFAGGFVDFLLGRGGRHPRYGSRDRAAPGNGHRRDVRDGRPC